MQLEIKPRAAKEADEAFDRSLIAALVAIFILRTASGAMGVLVSLYLKSLGVSGTVAGLFSAAFYAVELVASPVFGAWSDRYGRKWFMMLGPIFGGIAVVVTALTANIPLLLFTRLLEGLSAASSVPSALSYISDASDRSVRLRGRVVSVFEIATIGGLALGGVIAGVMWDRVGRLAFGYDALIYLVSLAIFAWGVAGVREVAHSVSEHGALRDYVRLFRDPHLLSFAPAWLAVNAILGVWVNLLPFLMSGLDDPHQYLVGGFSGTAIGLVLATFIFIFAGGILIWGFFFSHVSRGRVMLLGGVGLLFGVAAAYGINHLPPDDATLLWPLLLVLLVSLFLESGFTPAALGYLADLSARFPAHRGAIMGLYSVLLALGQSLGTGIGGRFADWRGVDGIILWTLILNVVAIVCVVILGRLPDATPSAEV